MANDVGDGLYASPQNCACHVCNRLYGNIERGVEVVPFTLRCSESRSSSYLNQSLQKAIINLTLFLADHDICERCYRGLERHRCDLCGRRTRANEVRRAPPEILALVRTGDGHSSDNDSEVEDGASIYGSARSTVSHQDRNAVGYDESRSNVSSRGSNTPDLDSLIHTARHLVNQPGNTANQVNGAERRDEASF